MMITQSSRRYFLAAAFGLFAFNSANAEFEVTFCNSERITIPKLRSIDLDMTKEAATKAPEVAVKGDDANRWHGNNCKGKACPYPSVIEVNDPRLKCAKKITVTLHGFTHEKPKDVDILLVGPGGCEDAPAVLLMSDAGGCEFVSCRTITFSDCADRCISRHCLEDGVYKPTNYCPENDQFCSPAPNNPEDYGSELADFLCKNPNGCWKLYVMDDEPCENDGAINCGWSITFTVCDPEDNCCETRNMKQIVQIPNSFNYYGLSHCGNLWFFNHCCCEWKEVTSVGDEWLSNIELKDIVISGCHLYALDTCGKAYKGEVSGICCEEEWLAKNGNHHLPCCFRECCENLTPEVHWCPLCVDEHCCCDEIEMSRGGNWNGGQTCPPQHCPRFSQLTTSQGSLFGLGDPCDARWACNLYMYNHHCHDWVKVKKFACVTERCGKTYIESPEGQFSEYVTPSCA